ncbi:MAG: hypothetical protein LBI71_00140 [Enterobacteriaceae bacterium]|jgi:hypothetical protein|nr:hypothetical protein [Enterobacteriaceae bacterium]
MSETYKLSFNLTPGIGKFTYKEDWGYLSDKENFTEPYLTYGVLTDFNASSNTRLDDVLMFSFEIDPTYSPVGNITLVVLFNAENFIHVIDWLHEKNLTVTVNGINYDLGIFNPEDNYAKKSFSISDNSRKAMDAVLYYGDVAEKLGELIQKNVGKPLKFELCWK